MRSQKLNRLVTDAKELVGVKYKLGAAPYPKSKRFDCSSFTQFLYMKYGVQLRRTAREQALQGKLVDRKDIKRGDLLFFAVPDRFSSDDIPGHVGIYYGNGMMIHCIPDRYNKVIISNLSQTYWEQVFLCAKRVL